MKIMAWVLWVLAAVWVVMALFGADQFQDLYGGTSGAQFFFLALSPALVVALLGLWAYRRSLRSDTESRPTV
jgi:H+/Cl- antiporter ClcA